MYDKNAAEMQNKTRSVGTLYAKPLAPGWEKEMALGGLSYGSLNTSGYGVAQRTMKITFGVAAYLQKGEEMCVPARMQRGRFVIGYDITELIAEAGLKNEKFVDVWTTTYYRDFERDSKVCREVAGMIRRYDIAKGEFEPEEKTVSETFVMADPERDARNAAQQKKRQAEKRKRSAEAAKYDRRAAYGGYNATALQAVGIKV